MKITTKSCCGLILLAFLGCISSDPSSLKTLEHSIVFQPARYPVGNWKPKDLLFDDVRIATEDGLRLHGWYCEGRSRRDVVLYAHGNAGNVTDCYWKLRFLTEKLGVTVLCFDYRGFGKSEGTASEEGVLKDARAARRWLAIRAGIRESDIVLLGTSLGGAVAVDLAARDGARGLILESTFTSIPDVADSKRPKLGSAMSIHLDSLAKIRDYHGPLLQAHGDADQVVPLALGEKLFRAANEPKQFVRIKNGVHMAPPSREYQQALEQFFKALPPVSHVTSAALSSK
jgi:fermentation-respiration switch protein FrsA (DUF1100 family)